ncbi:hypothetical protein ACG83_31205 [Frankia sp. R43]|uniref:CHAT domain-containing protein n=1 Tax=Frankia sp. R43 TaxID=269536 RepID=UPI0006CA0699|nr:CHAT domain-containing protein [Frankia sp. R43]KPM52025.1 hypothetical protein ACG83_31205 [Frankia sp. R43]
MSVVRQVSAVVALLRARRLVRAGNPDRVLDLAASAVGLTRDDFVTPDRLGTKLRSYLDGLPNLLAASYVLMLAGALGMVRRNLDGLHVFEIFLDVVPGDYADTDALRQKLRRRCSELPAEVEMLIVLGLAGSLGVLGRDSEAVALIRADLAFDPLALDPLAVDPLGPDRSGPALPHHLDIRLEQRLAGLSPDAVAAYLTMLVPYLDSLGAGADGAAILEARLGLKPDDYQSPRRLGARLDPLLHSLTTREAPTFLLLSLTMLLSEADQAAKALALVEWYVGADAADYRDPDELGRKWRAFCDANYPDLGPTLWRVWTDLLVETERPDDVLAVIEADTGLRLADLSTSEQFGPRLTQRLRRAQGDTAAAYLVSLTFQLNSLGYAEQAGLITDWYLRGYQNLWQVPDDGDPGVTHVIGLVRLWLELRSASEPDFAWQLSGQAVAYLRRSLLFGDLKLADRREFIGYLEGLRGQIRSVGYSWTTPSAAARPDPARVLSAQLWDAELGQRALFEEFLLTRVEAVTPGTAPQDGWPYPDDEPINLGPPQFLQASPEGLLRLLGEEDEFHSAPPTAPITGVDNAASGAADRAHRAADPATDWAADQAKEAWLGEAEELVRQGVTEELLAEALGPGTMLVRAGFRPNDGALIWAALRVGDDGRVLVVAAGVGEPADQLRARWASLRHDLGLQMATVTGAEEPAADARTYPSVRAESQGDRLAAVLIETLTAVTAALDEVIDIGWGSGEWLESIARQLAALGSGRSSIASHGHLGDRLGEMLALPPNSGVADQEKRESSVRLARLELGRLLAAAQRHQRRAAGHGDLLDEVDEMTRGYLAEMAEIWPLGALSNHLDRDTDLVFQLEDALQQVPVAHYPFEGGTPLYSLVRSTRISLSVLVTIMQSRAERRFATDARRVLALSHFGDHDQSGQIARLLHYGHRWLARQSPDHQLTSLNAAEIPPGGLGNLRAALESGPGFQTVTVCGHGFLDEDHPPGSGGARWGIELHDGPWRGVGCDLRSVNFLLLPSCSMGRLRQAGDADVTGMCALLALNRARSVLACRWPVLADQAIAFTHEVVATYLALSVQAEDRERGSLRARAVNIARHHFLDAFQNGSQNDTAGPAATPVFLNTVAAFELYGLA